jgi:hypothetical protein
MNYSDDLAADIDGIFNPEPDEDREPREFPHKRLIDKYGFDFKFMETFAWEGATMHPNTRTWPEGEPGGDDLTRSMDVPGRLFLSGLRVFADSILVYSTSKDKPSELRFYPPVVLTFWSAFEAFVRHSSELMIHTSKDLPSPIADYLRDETTTVNNRGVIGRERRYRAVLDRYAVLLQYGFNHKIDRGNKHWQALEGAKDLRDYYTHIDAMNSRSISSDQVLNYMEAVMLGIIWPSAEVQRTILLRIHDLYWTWAQLVDLARDHLPKGHIEQPFFHAWRLDQQTHLFYCPFTSVDEERFPNSDQQMARWRKEKPSV